ncbi:MAG TPA: hypothetical protein DIT99_03865 [Candidatus Latescibacteria bacterium]|nr:hypothetical protein [Candidatus Latescibacterota bacterium]
MHGHSSIFYNNMKRRCLVLVIIVLGCLVTSLKSYSQSHTYIKVYGDHTVGQMFRYPMSNLDRIGILVRRPELDNTHNLIVRIQKSPDADQDIVVIRTQV